MYKDLKGGHGIPDKDIERRFVESMDNLKTVLPLCDLVVIYDNSNELIRIATYRGDECLKLFKNAPDWYYQSEALWRGLQYAPEQSKSEKKCVLHAVKIDGMDLQFVSDELKDDKEVVLTAVRQNPEAIQFASERLYNDPDVCEVAGYDVGEPNIDGQNLGGDDNPER